MERRGADEGVDAAALGGLDGLGAAVDVLAICARARPQITAFLARRAISCTLSKSPWLAIGKAGLDDVDAHLIEQLGDLELLLEGHGGAGALLAVAQGSVEDHDAVAGRRVRFLGFFDRTPLVSSLSLGASLA